MSLTPLLLAFQLRTINSVLGCRFAGFFFFFKHITTSCPHIRYLGWPRDLVIVYPISKENICQIPNKRKVFLLHKALVTARHLRILFGWSGHTQSIGAGLGDPGASLVSHKS